MDTGVAGELPPQARRFVERIRDSARHQHALIEEVLAFSRLEAGREEVLRSPVKLEDIWKEVGAVVEPLARGKGLAFEMEADGAPATIETDGRKLRQVLLHLLGNAVKFTERGEVRLRAESRGRALILLVRDTGVGIPAGDLERIFEPFTQADDSVSRAHGGTGLGLAITRRLLGLLGGSIAVRSEPGRGTTFEVRVPIVEVWPVG